MRQDPDEPPAFAWPSPPPAAPRRKRGGTGLLLIVALVAAAVGAGAAVVLDQGSGGGGPAAGPTPASSLNPATVTNQVEPGMVDIVARDTYSGLVAEGTGLIVSASGLVLTNNHIIDGSTNVRVTLVSSGHTYPARVVGYDSADDVAVLRLTGAAGLHPVTLGNSSRVRVGDQVIALGNAEGQGGPPAASTGYITALDQTISPSNSATGSTETLHGTIETSAQIAEGDSGGALANTSGQVIGMVTAAASGLGGQGANSGYAIPVNAALTIERSISAGRGSATVHIGLPAFIGVEVTNSGASCGEFGTGAGQSPRVSGAKICTVYPGTPASRAGLAAGDVITSADGHPVGSASALTSVTGQLRPGTTLSVLYVDTKGTSRSVRITLTTGPAA